MYVTVGDTVEVIHHMSNRGKVLKVYYVPVKAGISPGPLSKMRRIVFVSDMDGKTYDMKLQDLRIVKE